MFLENCDLIDDKKLWWQKHKPAQIDKTTGRKKTTAPRYKREAENSIVNSKFLKHEYSFF